jgi:hypothetical protein
MRLLILSFSYAPRSNPRATRWTTLAGEFARKGHSVLVITSWQQGLPEQETVNGVQIYRVGMQSLEHLRRMLSANRPAGMDRPVAEAARPVEAGAQGSMPLRLLKTLNQKIWRKLWWPDSSCIWLRPALNTARRLLAQQPADAVISVSPTFSAVVAGHLLALTGNAAGAGLLILAILSVSWNRPPQTMHSFMAGSIAGSKNARFSVQTEFR